MTKRLLILSFLLINLCFYAQEEKRLALVIGNAKYDKEPLKNPVNDAELIKDALDSLDFNVIIKKNIKTRSEFIDAIEEFGNELKNYDVAFIYYAGHGVQVESINYLLPTKEVFESEFNVKNNGVSVQALMSFLNDTNKVNILVLDACRNNPYEKQWNPLTRGSDNGKGLAKINTPPNGIFIAFSAYEGQLALDGSGSHSYYAKSLAENIKLKNIDIHQVFRNVKKEVQKITLDKQRPVVQDELMGNPFYFIKNNISMLYDEIWELRQNEKYYEALDKINILMNSNPNDPNAYRLKADVYVDLKQNEKALDNYVRSISIEPLLATFFNRALLYVDLGEYEKALFDYSKCIELDSSDVEVYIYRAILYNFLGEYEKVLSDFDKCIELDPDNPEPYYRKALYYNNNNEHEKAKIVFEKFKKLKNKQDYLGLKAIVNNSIDDYNKAIKKDPENYWNYNNRGLLYYELQQYQKALLDFNKCIELYSDNHETYLNRGIVYHDLEENEKALADYNKSIELDPLEPNTYFNRALLYEGIGENEKALFDYNKYIELDPEDLDAYLNRALLYEGIGENEKALADYSKCIELDPLESNTYFDRAILYNFLGEYEKALSDYKKCIELDPLEPNTYFNRALLYEGIGENEKALFDYNKYIELDPEDLDAYHNRAYLYYNLKDFEKAISDLKKCIELDPTDYDAFDGLAMLYVETGEDKKAFTLNTKMISLFPEKTTPFFNRGKLYIKLKQYNEAETDYFKAIEIDYKDPESYYYLAVIYELQGKYMSSVIKLTEAILRLTDSDNNDEDGYYISSNDKDKPQIELSELYIKRGELLEKLHKYDMMCEDYKKACELENCKNGVLEVKKDIIKKHCK